MEKIFITIIMLYALFVALYFLGLKLVKKKKKNIVGKGSSISEMNNPVSDIVGKSLFVPLQAPLPKENIQENKKSAVIPPDELDETFTDVPPEGEDNLPMDIDFPLEYEDSNDEDDSFQEDDNDFEGDAPSNMATGLDFNSLAVTIKTIDKEDKATTQEKRDAGKVLVELQQTDMFEQLVSSPVKPNRAETVKTLLAEHLSAYHAKLDAGNSDSHKKAPADFDIRDFL